MKTEAAIRINGMPALISAQGLVEAERFLATVSREKFDYTQWRKVNLPEMSVDEIATAANKLAESLNQGAQRST